MSTTEGSFAHHLRSAMGASGLSARETARRCTSAGAPVSAPTLRAWATGASHPSRRTSFEAIGVLEQVLGAAPGRLTTALHATDPLSGSEDSVNAQLLAELHGFGARCGLPAAWLLRRDLISTTLDLDRQGPALIRHQVLATAVAPGVDGLLCVVHGGDAEVGGFEVAGGEVTAVEPISQHCLAISVRLPRQLEEGEPALVELIAPARHDLGAPGRVATLSPWPSALIVATIRASDRVYSGRAVRTDLDSPRGRMRTRELELLPGVTGMQCVAREVQAAEVAVEW